MKNWADYSFIIRSENRKRVFELLEKPQIPTNLAEQLQLNLGYVSNILISLIDRGLVKCLNPGEKRHRLYVMTEKGNKIMKGLIQEKK